MTFLNPFLLLLATAAAVPLLLHLLQRHQGPRVVFPALRYLRRAETESARRIRLRQLVLLAVRMLLILLLALAAARPFLKGGGAAHRPTAVALVIDNSLSTAAVVGDRRVFDEIRDRALESLELAGPDDLFWVLAAAEPWEVARPLSAEQARARVRRLEPRANRSDLVPTLGRAAALLATGADGRSPEIHLLTDLQATAFSTGRASDGLPPLIVGAPAGDPPLNRGIGELDLAGGLAPRAGERGTVTGTIVGADDGQADSVSVRLRLGGRVVSATRAPVGATFLLSFPPQPEGMLTGWVELDPDALRADDRRYLAVRIEPPPTVAASRPLAFVTEALAVLDEAGRIRSARPADADVVVSAAAEQAVGLRQGQRLVLLPPADPLELPGANRRLAAAGVTWRWTLPVGAGEARLAPAANDPELAAALAGARLRVFYPLEPVGTGSSGTPDSVLLRLTDGSPWAARGVVPEGGGYVIFGSPLSAEASTLPTSLAMVPLLDRAIGAWLDPQHGSFELAPGERVELPADAETLEGPEGESTPLGVISTDFQAPAQAGIFRVLRGQQTLATLAVNAPAAESDLRRLDGGELEARLLGEDVRLVRGSRAWQATIYRDRVGNELWPFLMAGCLLLLLAEAVLASAGRARTGAAPGAARARPVERTPRPAARA